ncbi:alpha-amylase, partial [Salmonella enterica subsp. enterica serovar Infantis]
RSGTPTLMLSIKTEPERTAQRADQCPVWDGSPLTLDVRQTCPEGTVVRDYYSGQTDTVQNGQITLQPADSHGLLLLERAETHA